MFVCDPRESSVFEPDACVVHQPTLCKWVQNCWQHFVEELVLMKQLLAHNV